MPSRHAGIPCPMTSDQARRLRQNLTDAEARLWSVLRRRQMEGRHFRRQAPVGPYIADFVCFAENLIVEVDGGQHAETTRARDDAGQGGSKPTASASSASES